MKLHEALAVRLAELGWTGEDIASGVKSGFYGKEPRISPRRRIEDRQEWSSKAMPLSQVFTELHRDGKVVRNTGQALVNETGTAVASLLDQGLVESMFTSISRYGQMEVERIA